MTHNPRPLQLRAVVSGVEGERGGGRLQLGWAVLVVTMAATVGVPIVIRGSHGPPAESPSPRITFSDSVMPLLDKLSCNATACHGASAGKGGLKLSLFGAYPNDDYIALTRAAGGRRVDAVEPRQSLFLLKATGALPHDGGLQIEPGSKEHELLAAWVAGGMPFRGEDASELASIDVSPRKVTLEKGATAQLVVRARFSDDSEQVVTGDALFKASPAVIATVDQDGRLQATGHGQTTVVVSYQRRFATVEIVVPRSLPQPFPDLPTNNRIDELVFAKLEELGIPPSDTCSDAEFIRRVYLDVIGTLPTPDVVRSFLNESDDQKRGRVIDLLLDSEEFANYWALKWGDLLRIKSEFPSNLWPNAVQAYHRWIRDSIAKGKPYDQFARELLTSSGSNFRVPPVNYYRAFLKREPQNLSEATALVFMGARIGCARCHAHPEERWTLDDSLGLAAFFSQVRYKSTTEWKEEIVYLNLQQKLRHPATNEIVVPTLPGGEAPEIGPSDDARELFARWLTDRENPWFARNIVNRTWFWLLGRGIVHEPDDLRTTNPPTNPELLDYLEGELVSHGFDLKHIYRRILSSRTYQLSFRTSEWNRDDARHFSHY
jgi:hypothetical protein